MDTDKKEKWEVVERFIPEDVLIPCGVSEQDFQANTLTDEQKQSLEKCNLIDGFDETKQINVRREPSRHGITISQ